MSYWSQFHEAYRVLRQPPQLVGLSTNIISCSIVVTWLIFILSEVLSTRFQSYRKLRPGDKIGWSTRVASSIHATLVTILAFMALWKDASLWEHPLLTRNAIGEVAMCITTGYLLGDLVLIVLHFDELDTPHLNRQTIIHHLCGIIGYVVCLHYGACQFFGLFRLLSESSTPFLNNRWFMDKAGLKQTRAYLANGVILASVFFQSRIFVLPIYWHTMWKVRSQIYRIPAVVQVVSLIVPVALDCLNIMWFRLLLRGCLKAMNAISPVSTTITTRSSVAEDEKTVSKERVSLKKAQ